MKVKLLFALCLLYSSATFAQKAKNWQLNSYQFNMGGVMSTKIPAASYANYESILSSQYEGLMVWDTPKSLTNLRMNPIYNANIQLFNSNSNAIQRFGFSLNSRKVSSFLTQTLTPVDTSVSLFGYILGDLRLDHTSPVVTVDYAYLKQLNVTKQLKFQFGTGAYLGYSLGNKISTIVSMTDPPVKLSVLVVLVQAIFYQEVPSVILPSTISMQVFTQVLAWNTACMISSPKNKNGS